jgi:hypothetical protein
LCCSTMNSPQLRRLSRFGGVAYTPLYFDSPL